MKPVLTSTDVPNPREQVFDFLDVMANHEPFTNHMLKQWEYSGPDRGIGSKARVAGQRGRPDRDRRHRGRVAPSARRQIVERNVGPAGGASARVPTSSRSFPTEAPGSTSNTPGSRRR